MTAERRDPWRCLACPHCGARLTPAPDAVRCPAGHSFDVAAGGHLTLLAPKARLDTADTSAMVQARAAFLGGGHYDLIAEAVATAAAENCTGPTGPMVLEIGAGTGRYLSRVLRELPHSAGIALDASRPAAKVVARTLPGVLPLVADAWSPLPLLDRSIDVVLTVFAPRVLGEIARVLRPGGHLVVVTPEPEHLAALVAELGLLTVAAGKLDRLRADAAGLLTVRSTRTLSVPLQLTPTEVLTLADMGPSAHHRGTELPERAANRSTWTTSAEIRVTVLRKPAPRLDRVRARRSTPRSSRRDRAAVAATAR